MTQTPTTAVDLTWDRRDRGGDWLVVERGYGWDSKSCTHYLTDTGRIVASSLSQRGANNAAGKRRASARRNGVSIVVDVLQRGAVRIVCVDQPYGCISGQG